MLMVLLLNNSINAFPAEGWDRNIPNGCFSLLKILHLRGIEDYFMKYL